MTFTLDVHTQMDLEIGPPRVNKTRKISAKSGQVAVFLPVTVQGAGACLASTSWTTLLPSEQQNAPSCIHHIDRAGDLWDWRCQETGFPEFRLYASAL